MFDPLYKEAFEKLKELITSYPILRYPDFKKKFTLTTDASNFALGAVLSQCGFPICYASRTLNKHERNYSAIEKELLGIVWATKYFRPYLFGSKFLLQTDHQPLVWLNSLQEPNSKLQRWRIRLNEYDFEIEHIKGKENKVADFLSRINTDSNEIHNVQHFEILVSEELEVSSNKSIRSSSTQNVAIPKVDQIINKFSQQLHLVKQKQTESLTLFGRYKQIFISEADLENSHYLSDILRRYFKKGSIGIYSELDRTKFNILQEKIFEIFQNKINLKCVECSKRAENLQSEEKAVEIIGKIHDESNHRGIIENYTEMKYFYFYPRLKELCHKFINNCDVCNLAKYDRGPLKYKFEFSETPKNVNQIVHADIFYCCKEVFLTFVDKFSKHLMVQRLNDRNAIKIIQLIRNRF